MAYFSKDAYLRKQMWRAEKNAAQKQNEALTEEEHEFVSTLHSRRHNLHCSDANDSEEFNASASALLELIENTEEIIIEDDIEFPDFKQDELKSCLDTLRKLEDEHDCNLHTFDFTDWAEDKWKVEKNNWKEMEKLKVEWNDYVCFQASQVNELKEKVNGIIREWIQDLNNFYDLDY